MLGDSMRTEISLCRICAFCRRWSELLTLMAYLYMSLSLCKVQRLEARACSLSTYLQVEQAGVVGGRSRDRLGLILMLLLLSLQLFLFILMSGAAVEATGVASICVALVVAVSFSVSSAGSAKAADNPYEATMGLHQPHAAICCL